MLNEQDPRKLAQDALELANKATPGPWFGVTNLEVQTTSAALAVVLHHWGGYDQALANCEFMGKSRQLVPDLAAALLAALDRVSELQGKLAESERWSLVLKRLYYDELAKNGRFECCCCGEVASDGMGHRCQGKKGEVGS